MLKRELRTNMKTLLIFSIILVAMLILVAFIYPSIIDSNVDVDSMMSMFPKEVLAALNMDVISITTIMGWFASEGYIFIVLLGGCYFAILGGTIVLKEQNDQTINFLYSKPVSKNKILTNKIICGLIYIVIFNILVGLSTLFGLVVNDEVDILKWFLLTVAPMFIELFFFLASLLISMFFKKTSKGISVGIGFVFIMYIFNVLGNLSDKISFIKYISIFNYMDSRQIITDNKIGLLGLTLTLIVCIVVTISSYITYNKKELGL